MTAPRPSATLTLAPAPGAALSPIERAYDGLVRAFERFEAREVAREQARQAAAQEPETKTAALAAQ